MKYLTNYLIWDFCYPADIISHIQLPNMSEYSSDEESIAGNSSTSVYLGFVDVPISKDEQPTIEDSFIGGEPLWMNNVAPAKDMLVCQNCNELMSLLLQSYAPLPDSNNDRIIYIFGCQKYQCSRKKGSIRCLKAIKKNEKREQQALADSLEQKLQLENERQYELKLKQGLFGPNDKNEDSKKTTNPFGGNPFGNSKSDNPFSSSGSSNPFNATPFGSKDTKDTESKDNNSNHKQSKNQNQNSYSQVASKNAPPKDEKKAKQNKPSETDIALPQYPGYILYVEKEKLKNENDVLHPIPENLQIEEDDSNDAGSIKQAIKSKKTTEEFKSEVHSDADFQDFAKRVAHNPHQVLRYDLGGAPLVYSSKDIKLKNNNSAPAPKFNPSSARQFELQLMPKAIIDLEYNSTNIAEGMEWGTIIAYTDIEDYIPVENQHDGVGYVEEWLEVEWEESVDYSSLKK